MQINDDISYKPKSFMGSLAKSLGFNVRDPRASLMQRLGKLHQEAYLCETELERRRNLDKQEQIKAALRALSE